MNGIGEEDADQLVVEARVSGLEARDLPDLHEHLELCGDIIDGLFQLASLWSFFFTRVKLSMTSSRSRTSTIEYCAMHRLKYKTWPPARLHGPGIFSLL